MYYTFICSRQLFLDRYHKRSNVGCVFSMVEGKFEDSVGSKSKEGQVNKVLAKVLCHNVCVLVRAAHGLASSRFRCGIGSPTKNSSSNELFGAKPPQDLDYYIYICRMHIDYGEESYE